MDRPWSLCLGKCHDFVAQMTLKRDGTPVLASVRITGIERSGFKNRLGHTLGARGIAKLDLAAAIWQFLGHHFMPAGRGIMKGIYRPLGICGPTTGQIGTRKMFVPSAPSTVVTQPRTRGPIGLIDLKLANPTAGKVDNFIARLRGGKDGRGKPIDNYRTLRFQHRGSR